MIFCIFSGYAPRTSILLISQDYVSVAEIANLGDYYYWLLESKPPFNPVSPSNTTLVVLSCIVLTNQHLAAWKV